MQTRFLVVLMLLLLPVGFAHAAEWAKYVAPDKSFSLHYPAGWDVTTEQNAVSAKSAATGEELQFSPIPSEAAKTPRQMAEELVESLRGAGVPDLTVQQWREGDSPDSVVCAHVAYTQQDQRFVGDLMVVKGDGGAMMIGYSVPEADYAIERSSALLQGLAGSLSAGDGSQAPELEIPDLVGAKMDANARAFLFVLEFAIGAPLASSQETLILREVKGAWGTLPPAERAQYDDYPKLMQKITRLSGEDVEPYRQELQQTVREEVVQGAPDDPALNALRQQIELGGKIVAEGDPPLIEVAATAYSEMVTYAALLQNQPNATPESLDAATVAQVRSEFIESWAGLQPEDRGLVLGTPGVWIVARTVLRTGTAQEQATIREQLKSLAAQAATQPAGNAETPATGTDTGAEGGTSWGMHNALMQMSQQTFNTNMWASGYQGWTPMGKIW